MYALYIWIVGFLIAVFSRILSNLMVNYTDKEVIFLMGGLILMLLSVNSKN